MINTQVNQLIQYGINRHLMEKEDTIYVANLLIDLLHIDSFELEEVEEDTITNILDGLLAYAIKQGLIEDNITEKDLFDTRIMNCLLPRESEVVKQFNTFKQEDPKKATDYFYQLAIDSNYIRKARIDQNIFFAYDSDYGKIQITINLSKPEKDPKEIAKAKLIPSSSYPKCLLCKENLGYAGRLNHPARQTIRLIPLDLNGHRYYMQYSPYVYYNEHCIILNENHIPMVINQQTFENLFSFVEQFPHYMLGSNADLPIVGGSILTHDHFQGGNYRFPIQDATVFYSTSIQGYQDVQVDLVNWPLSTIRLTGKNKESIIALSTHILQSWIQYSDESLDIISYSEDTRHNTITPIARMVEGQYQIDLVLRNNRTSDIYPLGIFHPHPEHHHIKKENIGLIEVMGLAILPARLKTELELLKQCLLKQANIQDYEILQKHQDWYKYLTTLQYTKATIDKLIEEELTKKFVKVLENAGVYKMDSKGQEGFIRFIQTL